MTNRLLLLSALATCFAFAQDAPKLRLPETAKPVEYTLDLKLDPGSDNFSGTATIAVELSAPTSTIWLHAAQMQIQSATVRTAKGTLTGKAALHDNEFLSITTPQAIPAGRATLTIEYSGAYQKTDTEGIFKQVEGRDAYVTTQFEPTSARRAFPSFDEPRYKTPYTLTIRHPKQLKAFANTSPASETDGPEGTQVTTFAKTKPLPTYLVAFAVGPYDIVDGGLVGKNGIRSRVIVPRGRSAEAAYAIEVTPKIVKALEDFFGIPYPYEKLDQITIPITVGFGAMENAGLITYSQRILLAGKGADTPQFKRTAVDVITHEVAHQWFGNMVTPYWWDDIWLNEAFASWMEPLIVDKLFPEWKRPTAALTAKFGVMQQDSLVTARKIREPIADSGDIGRAFDGITYNKGEAVIRMFEQYLGPEVFQRGVQSYLKAHAWKNATSGDFLTAMNRASGKDVKTAFSTFLDRPGVPLINAALTCTGAKPQLELTQQRSLPLGSTGDRNVFWQVPVCFEYGNGERSVRECHLVRDPREKITLQRAQSCPDWVLLSDDASGYYRVRYSDEMQQKLAKVAPTLPLNERIELLRNTFALISSGDLTADVGFRLVEQTSAAPERQVVQASAAFVNSVKYHVPPTLQTTFRNWVRSTFGERAQALGWQVRPTDSEDVRLLRPLLLQVAGLVGEDPKLIAEAKTLAPAWLAKRDALPGDIAPMALSIAAAHGDRQYFDALVKALRTTSDRRQRAYILGGLASFRDPALVQDALKLTLDPTVDIRELTFLFGVFDDVRETESLPWKFVNENYDTLLPRLPTDNGNFGGITLLKSADFFCDASGRSAAEAFFRPRFKGKQGAERELDAVLEAISLCGPRRAAYVQGLEAFFAKK